MRKLLLGLLMVCLAVSLSIPVFAGTVLDDAISNTSVTQSEGTTSWIFSVEVPIKPWFFIMV